MGAANMRYHAVAFFFVLAAGAFALPHDAQDIWEESAGHADAAIRMISTKEFIQNLELISEDDIRTAVRSTAMETGLHHYKFAEAEIAMQVKTVKAVVDKIVAWVKSTKDPFVGAADYLSAFVYDKVITAQKAINDGLIKAKVALKNNKQKIDLAAESGMKAAIEGLHSAWCNAIAQFLYWAATINPAGATTMGVIKAVDKATSAVGSIAGGYSSVAGYLGVTWGKAEADQLKKKADEANLEAALTKVVCGIAKTSFCQSGEAMGKKLQKAPSKW